MIDDIIADAKSRMEKTVSALGTELKKVRTGRAHPSILDHIKIEYYGSPVPLSQVSNIGIEDARTLSISVWEKESVQLVEKAILKSDLGLNPNTAGTMIRISMPPLTEERRRDLVRVVKQEAEGSRVAVRNIRRDANSDFKELLKEKDISEDESRGAEDAVQKLTDTYVAKIEEAAQNKEKELMEI